MKIATKVYRFRVGQFRSSNAAAAAAAVVWARKSFRQNCELFNLLETDASKKYKLSHKKSFPFSSGLPHVPSWNLRLVKVVSQWLLEVEFDLNSGNWKDESSLVKRPRAAKSREDWVGIRGRRRRSVTLSMSTLCLPRHVEQANAVGQEAFAWTDKNIQIFFLLRIGARRPMKRSSFSRILLCNFKSCASSPLHRVSCDSWGCLNSVQLCPYTSAFDIAFKRTT